MAKDDNDKQSPRTKRGLKVAPAGIFEAVSRASEASGEAGSESEAGEGEAPAQLGATKYVHAAFFAGGILTAYLTGKILAAIWNRLAEWPRAVEYVPQLLRYAEEERNTFTMLAGALVGLAVVIRTYRKEHIRRFADEVAIELSKVTWPDKETVTNGTIVVVVTSAVAAIYIALLDKLWAFVTTLVYGV